eukprot:scaffold4044_cov399-Prasinococcus_capsulatus_cf.AAC.14
MRAPQHRGSSISRLPYPGCPLQRHRHHLGGHWALAYGKRNSTERSVVRQAGNPQPALRPADSRQAATPTKCKDPVQHGVPDLAVRGVLRRGRGAGAARRGALVGSSRGGCRAAGSKRLRHQPCSFDPNRPAPWRAERHVRQKLAGDVP